MSLNIKLEAFEGPLDLLLHLIEKNKLDIYDIPIVEITDQYLECVKEMAQRDLDLASEFLVMAARLLMIKSKMLLPKPKEEGPDAEDMKEELTARLLELKMFKFIATELNECAAEGKKRYFGYESIPSDILKYRPKPDLDKLLYGIDTDVLNRAYIDALRRAADRIDPIRSEFGVIEAESVDIPETITGIKTAMKRGKKIGFNSLLPQGSGILTEIVTFLVLLEMMRSGFVTALQETPSDEITITVEKDVELFGASGEFFQ